MCDMTRRNKIRTNAGSGYLTIPIGKKFYKLRICDVELPAEINWRASHWQQIYQNYVNTQYFGATVGFSTTYIKRISISGADKHRDHIILLKCLTST